MNTITTQREQARTEAIRAAEWAADLASACDWFIDQLVVLNPGTDARRLIARDLTTELTRWATTARSNAAHHQDKANVITATLCAAARPRPT